MFHFGSGPAGGAKFEKLILLPFCGNFRSACLTPISQAPAAARVTVTSQLNIKRPRNGFAITSGEHFYDIINSLINGRDDSRTLRGDVPRESLESELLSTASTLAGFVLFPS